MRNENFYSDSGGINILAVSTIMTAGWAYKAKLTALL